MSQNAGAEGALRDQLPQIHTHRSDETTEKEVMSEPAAEQELAICFLPSSFLIFPHHPKLSLSPASHATSAESGPHLQQAPYPLCKARR